MREEKIGIEFINQITKEGYVKIPRQIRETYNLKRGDTLLLKIEKKIEKKV